MRSIEIKRNKIYPMENLSINVLSLIRVYPKGIWTAPSDKDLKNDILLSMKAGFNGARLHEKVFEDRFHYQRINWLSNMGRFSKLGIE